MMRLSMKLSVALAALWLFSGCALLQPRAKNDAPTNVNVSERGSGYALLYDLATQQKHSNLLSLIKKETPELKALLERISTASKATATDLEALAGLDPPLNLKATHLPRIEQAARDSIAKETSKEILHTNGVEMEFNLVSSQLAGLNYAAHLARSLGAVETGPRRKAFLRRTDRTYTELHAQAYKMLLTRYRR
jgi:hypothetical protein